MAAQPELKVSPGGSTFVEVTLNKPKDEGPTTRYIDPEMLFVVRVHLSPGGSIAIDRSGPQLDYYYTRLWLPKGTDGKTRGPYLSRLVVGTEVGYLTRESANFHDLRRASLGPVRLQTEEGSGAKIGREHATQWTRKAVSEAIERGDHMPAGLDESLVAQWLEDGYRLLDKVPLGEDKAPLGKAA